MSTSACNERYREGRKGKRPVELVVAISSTNRRIIETLFPVEYWDRAISSDKLEKNG